ncbi:hypothetical protein R5R35_008269 [Gryllus longicercus]|uniref:Retrovirus-related Pol polyprotein from transposon TNT 1-94 n=1 Tax=Gryllus longicercus TaxID=2509291 RepID=A0AAN9W251_9ORTH
MAERLDMNSLSKFDGSNYNQWRFQMNCALWAKGLYEIVHGTELKPENNNETQKASIKNDATAMFILTSALDYAQITLIENCESSHQIIDKLDSIYLQRSEWSKMIAHERFHQYRMKDSDSVAQHIANVENLAKKLKDIGETVSDAVIMTKIISTLPQKFLNFRQAWLSVSEDRQTLTNLTSRLVDEANLSLVEQMETAFTVSSGKNQSAKSKRSTKQSEPSSSGSSKQKSVDQNQEVKQNIKCYQCGKRGHIARFCRNKPKHKSSHRDKEFTSFNVEVPGGVNMENTWIMDSGASAHMSYRAELFSNMSAVSEGTTVVIGNNVSLPVIGKGDIEIEKKIKGEWYKSVITYVLFVPDLRRNLFSEAVATKKGWSIMKERKKAEILHGSKLIASAILDDNNNYRMLFRNISVHQAQQVTENSLKAWHDRLGDVNFTRVREMIKSGVISGITLSDEDEILCESCLYGKQYRFHHASREVREEEVGERVFSDVCGPIATESSGGARYFVLFKDSATSYLVVRTMKHKSDVLFRLKEYVRMVEKQQGRKVKVLHCDNGREYLNESLQEYLKREGIILENTSPYTPQQNGRIEREMRTVMESARSMMHAMNTSKYLWGEAVNTVVYILNRTPTSEKRSTTPYEAFMDRKPSLSHLKKFGCTAFMHVPDCQRPKLDDKSSKLMFVGYDGNSDNYRLFDPTTKKVKVSRNVIFD